MQEFFFFLFAAVVVISALGVVFSKNPVHSVFFLILAFFNAAGLFLLAGAEFLALILVIVYVGAVAVLFLFVVMMLNITYEQMREGIIKHATLGLAVGGVLLAQLVLLALNYDDLALGRSWIGAGAQQPSLTNAQALGQVMYTDYAYVFQLAGIILLVAMIGAIVLTHRVRPDVKKQSVSKQIARRKEKTVELVKVKPGQGVV